MSNEEKALNQKNIHTKDSQCVYTFEYPCTNDKRQMLTISYVANKKQTKPDNYGSILMEESLLQFFPIVLKAHKHFLFLSFDYCIIVIFEPFDPKQHFS